MFIKKSKKLFGIIFLTLFCVALFASISFAEEHTKLADSHDQIHEPTHEPTIELVGHNLVPELTAISAGCVEDENLVEYTRLLKLLLHDMISADEQNWVNGIESRTGLDLCDDCLDENNRRLLEVLKELNYQSGLTQFEQDLYSELKQMFEECDDECVEDENLVEYTRVLKRLAFNSITQDEQNWVNGIESRIGLELCDDCLDQKNKNLFDVLKELNSQTQGLTQFEQGLYTELKQMFELCDDECVEDENLVKYTRLLKRVALGAISQSDQNWVNGIESRIGLELCDDCLDQKNKNLFDVLIDLNSQPQGLTQFEQGLYTELKLMFAECDDECVEDENLVKYTRLLKRVALGAISQSDQNWVNGIESRIGLELCDDCLDHRNKNLFDVLIHLNSQPQGLTQFEQGLYTELKQMFELCDDECVEDENLVKYTRLLKRVALGSISQSDQNWVNGIEARIGLELCDDCLDQKNKNLFDVLIDLNSQPAGLTQFEQDLYTELKLMFELCDDECVEDENLVEFTRVLKKLAHGTITQSEQNWLNGIELRIGLELCDDCLDQKNKNLFDVLLDLNRQQGLTQFEQSLYTELKQMFELCDDECIEDVNLVEYTRLLKRLAYGTITPAEQNWVNGIELRIGLELCDDCLDNRNRNLFDVLLDLNSQPAGLTQFERDLYTELKQMFEECDDICIEEEWILFEKLTMLDSLGLLPDRTRLSQMERAPPEPCGECEDLVAKLVAENYELRNHLLDEASPDSSNSRRGISGVGSEADDFNQGRFVSWLRGLFS